MNDETPTEKVLLGIGIVAFGLGLSVLIFGQCLVWTYQAATGKKLS